MFRNNLVPPNPVVIEYDSRGDRVYKIFRDPYKARSFYTQKKKAGKNPTIKKWEG